MKENLKTNDYANRDAASDIPIPKTEDGGSGSTHGSAICASAARCGDPALVDTLVEMISQSPTPELVLVDVLWKVKTAKSFDRVGHTAMEWFTDLPQTSLEAAR